MNIVEKHTKFKIQLNRFIADFPELFPDSIENGYRCKDIRYSKRSKISIRRIRVGSISYTVRPSFVMPYHTAFTNEADDVLFLRKFDVPFWALANVFGKYPMYWYRMEQSLGRNSIVGSTIKDPDLVPDHVGADEKHSKLKGERIYIPTVVGEQCILGVSVSQSAGEEALTKAYSKFRDEAMDIKPEYSPKSVNTDGWKATMNAWESVFPGILVICCFLHVFIKIRDRSRKKFTDFFEATADRLWKCYDATSKASFSQKVRRLYEWVKSKDSPSVILNPIKKLKENLQKYSKAYELPGCHRTSNMVDRLMQRMDRHLFATFYFHGSLEAAELNIRGWALIHNFAPCNPTTVKKHDGWKSPAERLNKRRYHESWLQNLLISASMGGFKHVPPNPL
jgi:hypothetical protein